MNINWKQIKINSQHWHVLHQGKDRSECMACKGRQGRRRHAPWKTLAKLPQPSILCHVRPGTGGQPGTEVAGRLPTRDCRGQSEKTSLAIWSGMKSKFCLVSVVVVVLGRGQPGPAPGCLLGRSQESGLTSGLALLAPLCSRWWMLCTMWPGEWLAGAPKGMPGRSRGFWLLHRELFCRNGVEYAASWKALGGCLPATRRGSCSSKRVQYQTKNGAIINSEFHLLSLLKGCRSSLSSLSKEQFGESTHLHRLNTRKRFVKYA